MTRRRAGWRSPNIKLGSVQTAYMKKLMNSKVHSLVDKTNVDILSSYVRNIDPSLLSNPNVNVDKLTLLINDIFINDTNELSYQTSIDFINEIKLS